MTSLTNLSMSLEEIPKLPEWTTLSKEAIRKIEDYFHSTRTTPSFDELFLRIAHQVKTKSKDEQTQCGAVIVNEQNHIISVGYNGFPGGLEDEFLPYTRPGKHDMGIIHSELNAILNCEHRPVGCTIYVTWRPCINCMWAIAQSGIVKVVYSKSEVKPNCSQSLNSDDYEVNLEVCLWLLRNKVDVVGVDLQE